MLRTFVTAAKLDPRLATRVLEDSVATRTRNEYSSDSLDTDLSLVAALMLEEFSNEEVRSDEEALRLVVGLGRLRGAGNNRTKNPKETIVSGTSHKIVSGTRRTVIF